METNRVIVAVVLGIIVLSAVSGLAYLMKGNVDSDIDDQSDDYGNQVDCILSEDDVSECTGWRPEEDAKSDIYPV